jgi:hypothetical protein
MTQSEQTEITELLQRAHAIQAEGALLGPEHEAFVKAAEEAGIQRDAVLQALRERIVIPKNLFQEGQFVFAKSADNHFYVAELVELEGSTAKVHFLTGGEAVVSANDIRVFSLTPGLKLGVFTKGWGIWSTGSVKGYDAHARVVHVDCYGTEESLPLTKVRLIPERTPRELAMQAKLMLYSGAALLCGTGLGMAIMKFLSR